jgi:hypothetical protein
MSILCSTSFLSFCRKMTKQKNLVILLCDTHQEGRRNALIQERQVRFFDGSYGTTGYNYVVVSKNKCSTCSVKGECVEGGFNNRLVPATFPTFRNVE